MVLNLLSLQDRPESGGGVHRSTSLMDMGVQRTPSIMDMRKPSMGWAQFPGVQRVQSFQDQYPPTTEMKEEPDMANGISGDLFTESSAYLLYQDKVLRNVSQNAEGRSRGG